MHTPMNFSDPSSPSRLFISDVLARNGPEPDEYIRFLLMVEQLKADDVEPFRSLMQPILTPSTIIGFSFTKPFGYNGDFFIIEKMYQNYVNPDPRFEKWDKFFHLLPAARAVVNRKELAIDQFIALNELHNGEKDVLILGSGPANEVHEYLTISPGNQITFDLIDLDERAIAYAGNKNRDYLSRISFHHKNAIRFVPPKQYDLIWSAGLFDYFKDKHFIYMIRKYYAALKPGGKMIIGNFNVNNPSRKIMEVLGDWFLYHRSEEELREFSIRSDIPEDEIQIMAEPLFINLFLTITKKPGQPENSTE